MVVRKNTRSSQLFDVGKDAPVNIQLSLSAVCDHAHSTLHKLAAAQTTQHSLRPSFARDNLQVPKTITS